MTLLLLVTGVMGLLIIGLGLEVWTQRKVVQEVRAVYTDRTLSLQPPGQSGLCAKCYEPVHAEPPYGVNLELWNCHGQQIRRWPVYNGDRPMNERAMDRLSVDIAETINTWELLEQGGKPA